MCTLAKGLSEQASAGRTGILLNDTIAVGAERADESKSVRTLPKSPAFDGKQRQCVAYCGHDT